MPSASNLRSAPASAKNGIAIWRLMRLDDNGNEFEMARFEDEATALAARDDYERRGHKQTYFLQACPAAPATSGTLSSVRQ